MPDELRRYGSADDIRAVAASRGMTLDHVTADQLAAWIAEAEGMIATGHDPDDAAATVRAHVNAWMRPAQQTPPPPTTDVTPLTTEERIAAHMAGNAAAETMAKTQKRGKR